MTTLQEGTPLWQSLKQLVALDLKKADIENKIKKIEGEVAEDKQMLPELQGTIAEMKKAIVDAKKHVDLQELNAKDLKEQEAKKRAALDNVKNEKQYAALEKEISSLLQQISEQDDLLVKAWHNLDIARKKEEAEKENLEEKIVALEKEVAEKTSEIETIRESCKEFENQKKVFSEKIPPEWLSKYERMRHKVADPIVPLINTSCSSCYYSVSPQDATRLKNNAILPCRSCYRLLYYDKGEEADSKEASW